MPCTELPPCANKLNYFKNRRIPWTLEIMKMVPHILVKSQVQLKGLPEIILKVVNRIEVVQNMKD